MNTTARLAIVGLLFLLKLGTGYWLGRSGKPYSVALSTLHKILSLLTVASIALTVRYMRGGIPLGAAETGALVVTGVLFAIAISTGGMLSMDRPAPAVAALAHKVAPYLALLSSAVAVYLAF